MPADLGEELSAELSKVVCQLETAIEENRASQVAVGDSTVTAPDTGNTDTDSVDVEAYKVGFMTAL